MIKITKMLDKVVPTGYFSDNARLLIEGFFPLVLQ